MANKLPVSIVVPTLNEAENIAPLIVRINNTLFTAGITYEIIIIDDNSIDETVSVAKKLAEKYPIRVYLKQGQRGKAYSLLEGFQYSGHPLIAMIDADLQYPPEELATMHKLLTKSNADIIVTKRKSPKTSWLRKLSTRVYNLLFARLLFGINFDTQSGLKLFRKEILDNFELTPSPWSFDLEFLIRSLENKLKIVSHTIIFAERSAGITKVKLLNVTMELVSASLKLRARSSIRQIRAGHRENNSFLEKAFSVLIISTVVALSSIATPVSTSALTIDLSDITDSLGLTTPTNEQVTPAPAITTTPTPQTTPSSSPATQSSNNAGNSTVPTNAASVAPATASESNNSSSQATTTSTGTTSTRRTAAGNGTSSTSTTPAGKTVDSTKLAAATDTRDRTSGLYGAENTAAVSSTTKSAIVNWVGIVLLLGMVLLLVAILFSSISKRKLNIARQELSRQ